MVLLAHNERPYLEAVVSGWIDHLAGLGREYEVVLVDDGRSDGTGELAQGLAGEAWFQAFARSVPENLPYLNREQDLGVEGLRRAKESWHPAFLVEKYTARVRKQAVARAREPVGQSG